jgi:hypothetical protein
MAIAQRQRFCRQCGRRTLHVRTYFGDGWGCLLTILTGGLFFVVWFLLGAIQMVTNGYRCQQCGRRN